MAAGPVATVLASATRYAPSARHARPPFADDAAQAVGDRMSPYLPRVVFLSALSPARKQRRI